MAEEIGNNNTGADEVTRVNKTWSDGKLKESEYSKFPNDFKRLQCDACLGTSFEVLHTADYETTAQCTYCNKYFVVHSG
jgi:hypothetical protein